MVQPTFSLHDQHFIDTEIQALLNKNAIEFVPRNSIGFRSRLFTIPKKTGDRRPVLNLKPLNKFVQQRHFKMETMKQVCTLIRQGDYLTSIDLTDAFLHVLIHPSSRRYLQFVWKNQVLQWRTLPFGLALSPYVFTKVLRPVLRWARRKGIRITAYLDDLLIIAKDYHTSQLHTQMVQDKLLDLGFNIKMAKSSLIPSQQLEHLGFIINTQLMQLQVPANKIRDLRREASRMLSKVSCPIKQVASFIGKAQSLLMAVFPARLKTRHLLALKNRTIRHHKAWHKLVELPHQARLELEWWRDNLRTWNGKSFLPQLPEAELYTDASDLGWGIVTQNHTWRGQWNTKDQQQHINWKELMVIWKAIHLPKFQGKCLQIYCDNMTTIAYVNKFGGTRSPLLMDLANSIWNYCLTTNTRIQLHYIPSAFNPADSPSRRLQHQIEWRLAHHYFQHLNQLWGPHHVDLFASHLNHQLPKYVSWKWDPLAMATDAMSLDWSNLGRLYICPPWNLLPLIIQRLRDQHPPATLITPWWPSAIWFPTLQAMSTCRPLKIPRSAVLPPPDQEANVLHKNPHWSLTAWHVNGNA